MRIISGRLGGRRIGSLPGTEARPAMARTREALFSMLEARGLVWSGLAVLDLFAGTGSLAYEALSRGAAQAVLVDNSAMQCRLLARNNADLGLTTGEALIVRQDACRYLRKNPPRPFGLVFIDPPYRRGLADAALELLVTRGWLAQGAFVSAEIEKKATPAGQPGLESCALRLFGQTAAHIWKYNENSALSGHI